jgi:hypothetical protein
MRPKVKLSRAILAAAGLEGELMLPSFNSLDAQRESERTFQPTPGFQPD